jgi:HD-GYP domain-containing protein (c-di-GMP phosphodiesterase class II)
VDLEKEGKGIEELKEKAGKELDDRIVEVFIEKVLG